MHDRGQVAALTALLRQLAIGLSVHRLYPGDHEAAPFVAAVGRIRDALATARRTGDVRVDVRSGHFVFADVPMKGDGIDRLAHACFERRVEHLAFDGVPSSEDLNTWFDLLSMDAAELERSDGMAAALQQRGVRTIQASAAAPDPTSGEEMPDRLVDLADSVRGVDEDPTLDDVDLALQPGEGGASLFDRLARVAGDLPLDGSARTSFFQRAAWLLDALPVGERAVFGRLLFDGVATDRFAERFAGHLTDVALAALVIDVAAAEGADPEELGAQVATTAIRHGTLRQLLRREVPDDAPVQRETVLRSGFPQTDDDGRKLASLALVDVLLHGPREEHLAGIVENITEHLREAVTSGRVDVVRALLDAIDTARTAGSPDLLAPLGRPRRRALTPQVVATAARTAAASGVHVDVHLFAPFGSAAIEPLVGAVAEDPDSAATPSLLEVLVELSGDHPEELQAVLGRQRADVLTRLTPKLAEVSDPEVLPLLSRLALRPEPAILRAVVDGLVRHDEMLVTPTIAGIARRAPDARLRNRCLDELARRGAGGGRRHLEDLATARVPGALPWRARRRARRLARGMGAAP